MANVAKLLDIIFGANPSQSDLQAIVDRLSERLPKPIVTPAPVVDTESASSDEQKPTKSSKRS